MATKNAEGAPSLFFPREKCAQFRFGETIAPFLGVILTLPIRGGKKMRC